MKKSCFYTSICIAFLGCFGCSEEHTNDSSNHELPSTDSIRMYCEDGSSCTNGVCSDGNPCVVNLHRPGNTEPTIPEKPVVVDTPVTECMFSDIMTSRHNCGDCNIRCGLNQYCNQGICTQCNDALDFQNDPANCGACGVDCGKHGVCTQGKCQCEAGYSDCDGDGWCETAQDTCECRKGDTRSCYTGDEKTKGVGPCKEGYQECIFSSIYGYVWDKYVCKDEILPSYQYTCTDSKEDLDCNGTPDWIQDEDNDGYSVCAHDGKPADCCDNSMMCKTNAPELIHPGRKADCFGNELDDNCNGEIDENTDLICSTEPQQPEECHFNLNRKSCSSESDYTIPTTPNTGTLSSANQAKSSDALKLLHALDLCMDVVTEESGESGIIEYTVTQSNSTHLAGARQINVKAGMKNQAGEILIKPTEGETFALLSSGAAEDAYGSLTTADEKYTANGRIPTIYSEAHGGKLESHKLCGKGETSAIRDSVQLHVKFRAPKDAHGFKFDFRFFTREYPFYVCTQYNDFFLAILTDKDGKPVGENKDGNISFDGAGNPISVNNAFFTTCAGSACDGNYKIAVNNCPAVLTCTDKNVCGRLNAEGKDNTCNDGASELAAYYPKPFTGGAAGVGGTVNPERGGGTAWLTTTAPVKPGEVYNLDFYIWDTYDEKYDSTILLDNFNWTCEEQIIETGFADRNHIGVIY